MSSENADVAEAGDDAARVPATPAPSMTIEKAAGLGAVSSLAGIAASIVRSKTGAIYLGPEGLGVAAEIQQLTALGFVPLAAFTGPALVQAIARDKAGAARTINSAVSWLALIGLFLTVTLTVTSPWILPSELAASSYHLVVLACVASLASAFSGVASQALVTEGRLSTTTRLGLTSTILGVALVVPLTAVFHLSGQFLGVAATSLLMLPFLVRAARRTSHWPHRLLAFRFDTPFLRAALLTGAASLVAGATLQGALYAIRWRLELTGGPSLNGQFQAAWAIGSVYLGMVLSGIGSFAFPRYAAARDANELQREVDNAASFVIRLAPPIVLLAHSFAGVAVHLLYSSRFDTAVEILAWHLAGDVAKCLSWVYAGPLLFRGHVRPFVVTEGLAAGLLAGFAWLLVPITGAAGVGQAYLLTYSIYLLIAAVAARKSLGILGRSLHLTIAWLSTGGLAILSTERATPGRQVTAVIFAGLWVWIAGVAQLALHKARTSIPTRIGGPPA